jgi:hypothetical protein
MPPTTLGHYQLEDRLGHGGMGDVYRAFDTRLNRRVAIKIMRNDSTTDTVDVERFLREARAASALNHPNIVTIHDVGETGEGGYYIVQELVDGRVLRKLVGQAPADPDRGRRQAGGARADGRACRGHRAPRHQAGKHHGPERRLREGARLRRRAPDQRRRGGGHHPIRVRPRDVAGHAGRHTAYMAPEQARASGVGTQADIFALGVTLYELVSGGERPFVGATTVAVLAAILSEQPVPLARLNPSTPLALDALVHRMLSKQPDERPTARDVEDALTLMATGDTLTAPRPRRHGARRSAARASAISCAARCSARAKDAGCC